MSKFPSDENLDRLVSKLLADAAIAETETNEIADAPDLWWSVKRGIGSGPVSLRTPWPPPPKFWHWIALPSLAMAAFLLLFFGLSDLRRQSGVATLPEPPAAVAAARQIPLNEFPAVPAAHPHNRSMASVKTRIQISGRQRSARTRDSTVASTRPSKSRAVPVKSDFIALSLAPRPTSGQIVKLRVPSALMVSLGLVESVVKPSVMIDAEVLMGDDGSTHSIRFIR